MGKNSTLRKALKIIDELEEKKQDLESQFDKEKFDLITKCIIDYIPIYKNSKKKTKDKQVFKKLLLLFLEWMKKEYEYNEYEYEREQYYYCRDYNYCFDECTIGNYCSIEAEDEEGYYLPFNNKIFVDNFIKFVEEEEK